MPVVNRPRRPAFRWFLASVAAGFMATSLFPTTALAQLAEPGVTTPPGAKREPFKPVVGQPGKDVIWVPTPPEVVDRMLDMAQVKRGDRLVDLGSGDGGIAIAAAKRGAKARGIEFNPDMVALSKRNAKAAGVKVDFRQGDIFQTNFTDAEVVTMYLLPQLNIRLRPTLLAMKPGTRIVSHQFDMGDWEADETATIDGRSARFWRVPAQVGGQWTVQVEGDGPPLALQLTQNYQKLSGQGSWNGGAAAELTDARLEGGAIRFAVADGGGGVYRFEGTAGHDGRMQGKVTDPGGRQRNFTGRRS
ncbi:class I SAM-dependent methyltransferase [Aquabacterium sp. J223]|uniref:class I SAM-dependent methyltransferase n=1 Tax=Aquabacterium sp. J223 TaxID=2898431 RepID=UPI0021AD79D3|nr:class I SAM-dependent methyltransferase [Aquabacterium sp. J223]UUX95057.1 methyltransferase domain-containing protein [Aquabacterium sp. J223]